MAETQKSFDHASDKKKLSVIEEIMRYPTECIEDDLKVQFIKEYLTGQMLEEEVHKITDMIIDTVE